MLFYPRLGHSAQLATDKSVRVSPCRGHSAGFAGQFGSSEPTLHVGQACLRQNPSAWLSRLTFGEKHLNGHLSLVNLKYEFHMSESCFFSSNLYNNSVLNCFQQRWRASIQQRMRRGLSYRDGSHVGSQGPVDAWREIPVPVRDLLFDMFTRRYAFTRPEDLPRARAVWESTAQTNLRKSMWEARDKAMKTTGNRDPMAWLDYGPVWLRRDYWESLCERWATGPWQERSEAAKRNRSTHPE
ncbi:hypothetical protein Taro_042056 [Colocasia esculenta]|uniref:Uncharacterized protein n=1 Tax=Colocasia esculenta TaxID=4460 RepID=A0A843X1S8_COLES|nr:hypothetical protein [Colocasia esculenta]